MPITMTVSMSAAMAVTVSGLMIIIRTEMIIVTIIAAMSVIKAAMVSAAVIASKGAMFSVDESCLISAVA